MPDVTVIGGGLAGSEIALQLSSCGISIDLIEMRPVRMTPAHKTAFFAELVCSNSLKSENTETASGLLKQELLMLGCRLLAFADKARVPAGHALAVDRELFSSLVTFGIEKDRNINIVRMEQKNLDLPGCSVIATGPLTSDRLSGAIKKHCSEENLYFYDAISMSVSLESIDYSKVFKASRYGKGGADYWNIPFNREQYERLIEFLRKGPRARKHDFEDLIYFDACLPVEVMAERGNDTLRFGPLKPRGLVDPSTGKEPYAVLQLRQETVDGTMAGLVGFQNRLTRSGQRDLLKMIPGLENAEILRWGSIHRNTYLDTPHLLDSAQMSKKKKGLFFAGQIAGVEGYMESIAHGVIVSRNIIAYLRGEGEVRFPGETILGGLQNHLCRESDRFQPMNANFGLLPQVSGSKKERKAEKCRRSLAALAEFMLKEKNS